MILVKYWTSNIHVEKVVQIVFSNFMDNDFKEDSK